MEDQPEKQLKTPREKIQKSSDRYYAKKNEILRDNCLKNIEKNGRIPFLSSLEKYELSWEDTARALEVYIRDHPAENKKLKEAEELKKYKKSFPKHQDNITYLYNVYINTHTCFKCEQMFTRDRKRTMNIDEHGYFTSVLCSECTKKPQEPQAEKTQEEVPSD